MLSSVGLTRRVTVPPRLPPGAAAEQSQACATPPGSRAEETLKAAPEERSTNTLTSGAQLASRLTTRHPTVRPTVRVTVTPRTLVLAVDSCGLQQWRLHLVLKVPTASEDGSALL